MKQVCTVQLVLAALNSWHNNTQGRVILRVLAQHLALEKPLEETAQGISHCRTALS